MLAGWQHAVGLYHWLYPSLRPLLLQALNMNYSSNWRSEGETSIIIGCLEPLASRLLDLNADDTSVGLVSFTPPTDGQMSSQSSLSSNAVQYISTPSLGHRNRLSFGSKSDFQLPKEYRVQDLHFLIFVNECPSWMMGVYGTTKVNGEKLRLTQVALNPEIENTIKIGALHFSLFIVRPAEESSWPQIRYTSVPRSPTLENIQTGTTSSSTLVSRKPGKGPRSSQQLVHILSDDLGSQSSRSRVRKVIYRGSGVHAIGKIYIGSQMTAAIHLFDILYDVLKVNGSPSPKKSVYTYLP